MPPWPPPNGLVRLLALIFLLLLPLLLANDARRPFPTIAESQLDANRSAIVNGERIFVARQIPKMSRAEKRRLILEQFRREGLLPPEKLFSVEWTMRAGRGAGRRQRQKKRRDLSERPWRNQYLVQRQYRPRLNARLMARNTGECPNSLDAVTRGFNKRLYLFAGEMVHEVWRDSQGLQQRQAYPISDFFPDGPRRVSAALTNQKSGVTLLLDWRQVYRYRWNRRHKRFYLARNSPRELPSQIDFVPRIGFQWKDGHLILANKEKFASYDPYWNLKTFLSPKVGEYFPNLEMDRLAGLVEHGSESMVWMGRDGRVQLYDVHKGRLGLEFPLNLPKLLACLQPSNTTTRAVPG